MSSCLPEPKNEDGLPRKVGFELEFAGLKIKEAGEQIQELFGGEIKKQHRYEYTVFGTEIGDFQVELDARILKKMAGSDLFGDWDLDIDENIIRDSIGDIVDKLARAVIPLEVVMPPLPYNEIEVLERLRSKLQERKAEGTESSWMHAFGLHINIEVPNLETDTLLRYLRSFFVLYPWLIEELDIDFSRRISPFIDHFPDRYVEMVLSPGYQPTVEHLISDYLQFSPTRNRPLDMMPIFAMIDGDRVSGALGDEKNSPRPTFHYRLPNSRIEDPDWTFQDEWNRWLEVEKLAANREMLRKLSELYLQRKGEAVLAFKKEWAQTTKILLDL
ncbi:amidoligase family protein [Aliifodinibius sp. S!AR15-10]|uniref:amidoligase family protein n=1 Tax=Aliifodinibius sp. S!AR15-10 TaxID=2950437 RepID=UPI00285BAE69|nr:amidoligase family protein [Aliifodinibius sp. S!AR15-10]MDR8390093.1 amidoligase family protein [Aliifodinibius sp. S!AR15-10]